MSSPAITAAAGSASRIRCNTRSWRPRAWRSEAAGGRDNKSPVTRATRNAPRTLTCGAALTDGSEAMPVSRITLGRPLGAALLLAATAAAPAADNPQGAIEQSGVAKVPQNPQLPKLNLSEAQRQKIRQVLLSKNSQIEFHLKTT